MEAIWDQVVRASGVDASHVHLLPIPGAAVRGFNQAACYPPGEFLVGDPEDLVRGEMLVEANLDEHREKHRIAIYEDVDPEDPVAIAVLAAKLRHELRHAEQRETCGEELFALDELAGMLVSWKAGGLPRSTGLYHLKPIEMDANAASAVFLQATYAGEVDEMLTPTMGSSRAPTRRQATFSIFRQRRSRSCSCYGRWPRIRPDRAADSRSSSGSDSFIRAGQHCGKR